MDVIGGPEPISPRDMAVLGVIEEEDLSSFSFEGLKRRTGTHPETLSRVLGRLEEQGVIEKTDVGYGLTMKGREFFAPHQLSEQEQRLTLLKTMLPWKPSPQEVFYRLRGKWFGNLRWLGRTQTPEGMILKWVTDDGGVQLDARFSPPELTIEGKLLHGSEPGAAVAASIQLLSQITRLYSGPRDGRALLFELQPPYFMPN